MTRFWALLAVTWLASCAHVAPTPSGPAARADLPAAFDCAREAGATLVSAHRGGPASGFPENAIETLARSRGLGVTMLEVDVRRTADGALVLMHDETLERTTTGAGKVAETTLAALQALRLEDPDGVATSAAAPTLAEALAWSKGRAILQLDVKRGVSFAEVAAAVRAADAEDRVVIITYSNEDALAAARAAPGAMISATANPSDLDAFAAGGLAPKRVLAWTGTRAPDPALWRALRGRTVEPMYGAFALDREIARAGGEDRYVALARDGLAVLGSDRPGQALAALEAAGLGPARAAQCFTGIIGGA